MRSPYCGRLAPPGRRHRLQQSSEPLSPRLQRQRDRVDPAEAQLAGPLRQRLGDLGVGQAAAVAGTAKGEHADVGDIDQQIGGHVGGVELVAVQHRTFVGVKPS